MVPGYAEIADRAAAQGLAVFGGLHPDSDPDLPGGTRTLLLLGPKEPGFWPHVTASPEFRDCAADPIDRWSDRVIRGLAADLNALPVFPFGGPPHRPFFRWALESGRAHQSPVALLVHDEAGLMVSYRGALAFPQRIALPPPPPAPCDSCKDRPCTIACPASALTVDGYDIPACRAFLDTPEGAGCHDGGCRVRTACPISQAYGRLPEQSAYHMSQFHARP